MAAQHQYLTLDDIEPVVNGEDYLTLCTVCGAPIYNPRECEPSRTWMTRVILLSDGSLDFTAGALRLDEIPPSLLGQTRAITRTRAVPLAHTFFTIAGPDGTETTVAANHDTGEYHAQLYIPVHETCMYIVEKFIDAEYTAPAPLQGKWTLAKLWDVLRLRIEVDRHETWVDDGIAELREPHSYFINEGFGGGSAWEWDDEEALHDPLELGDYTRRFRALLKPVLDGGLPSGSFLSLRESIKRLPQELQDHIFSYLAPFSSASMTCNRVLDPESWHRLLCDGSGFPFLWDIDPAALLLKDTVEDRALDYESLARKLSQPDAFEKGHGLRKGRCCYGLYNRRRIWRVLENMRAGDLAHFLPKYTTLSIFPQPENDDEASDDSDGQD